MKRWLARIFVFLLLGAIVNVAVAWASTFKGRPGAASTEFFRSHQDGATWFFVPMSERNTVWLLISTFPFADVGWDHVAKRVPCWSMINERPRDSLSTSEEPYFFCLEVAHGWPYLSMTGWAQLGWNRTTGLVDGIVSSHSAFAIRKSRPVLLEGQIVPLRPIWPGFAINTVFYALGGWLLFAGPFVVRRWRRMRRGLCPKCAYDLRGSDSAACPECGAEVPDRPMETS